jgi:hypothetical protein
MNPQFPAPLALVAVFASCAILAACLIVSSRLLGHVKVRYPAIWRRFGRPDGIAFTLMIGPPARLTAVLLNLDDSEATALITRCRLLRRIGFIWAVVDVTLAVRDYSRFI